VHLAAPNQRLLQSTAGTVSIVFTDAEGAPADSAGTVTVGIADAAGAVVLAAGTATTFGGTGTGLYTRAVTATHTASLAEWTVTWTDAGNSSVRTTTVEVVGGFLYTVAQARSLDASMSVVANYPTADITAGRILVETEAEDILGFACVPRYRRVTLDGTGDRELHLPDNYLRSVISASIDGTALTSTELANLTVAEHRVISRPDGYQWTWGRQNVIVAYTHGLDRAFDDIRKAAVRRARYWLDVDTAGIPDRSTEYPTPDGNTYRLNQPTPYKTGDNMVDAVYGRHSLRIDPHDTDGKAFPASRTLQFDPQYNSLFHGGRR